MSGIRSRSAARAADRRLRRHQLRGRFRSRVCFAAKGEKELYKAIQAQDASAIRAVGQEHGDYRLLAYSLSGLMVMEDDPASAETLLESAFASGGDPAQEPFSIKYLQTLLEITIAPGISASLPVDRDAVGLSLAELKQERGDNDGAIDVVEQLEPSAFAAVSLADLYAAAGRYDDVVELTEGLRNVDDASAPLLTYRGMAFRHEGFFDAAHEALREALKSKSRKTRRSGISRFSNEPTTTSSRTRRRWLARISNGSWPRTQPSKASQNASPQCRTRSRVDGSLRGANLVPILPRNFGAGVVVDNPVWQQVVRV